MGLGAVSLDLMVALMLTSLARARIGRRTWQAVHWLAYLSWPAALVHSVGSSSDLQRGLLLLLAIGCTAAVAAALAWRIARPQASPPRARRVPSVAVRPRGSPITERAAR